VAKDADGFQAIAAQLGNYLQKELRECVVIYACAYDKTTSFDRMVDRDVSKLTCPHGLCHCRNHARWIAVRPRREANNALSSSFRLLQAYRTHSPYECVNHLVTIGQEEEPAGLSQGSHHRPLSVGGVLKLIADNQ
jgi:hypothetical protein